MQIKMPKELGAPYKSLSQKARVISEGWADTNMYCPSCMARRLAKTPTNTPVVDFVCFNCTEKYQLKSSARLPTRRINDAAHSKMVAAIKNKQTPNLLVLHYDSVRWVVKNLFVIPSFVFSLRAIERRKALSRNAQRAGHVLCNILLVNLPESARIPVVREGRILRPKRVNEQYNKLRPLQKLNYEAKGWTLHVLNTVQKLGKEEFSLQEVYAYKDELGRLHPSNQHIEDKIRQQLQRLRDMGFVKFLGRGRYRLAG